MPIAEENPGDSLGNLLSDYIPFLPSGARRAGMAVADYEADKKMRKLYSPSLKKQAAPWSFLSDKSPAPAPAKPLVLSPRRESYLNERINTPPAQPVATTGQTIFPGGKPVYPATQLKAPPLHWPGFAEAYNGWKTSDPAVRPSDINNQMLGRIPGGVNAFVAEQERNYNRDFPSPQTRMIDFDKRDIPVRVEAGKGMPMFHSGKPPGVPQRYVSGFNMSGPVMGPKWREPGQSEGAQRYLGLSNSSTGNRGVPILGHETTHSYLDSVPSPKDTERLMDSGIRAEWYGDHKGRSYVTDSGPEYLQAATTGLNAMRDISGQKLNDPKSVYQMFREVEKNPQLLDSIDAEHARLYRTYLNMKTENPDAANKLRDAVARDSQYLVGGNRSMSKVAALVEELTKQSGFGQQPMRARPITGSQDPSTRLTPTPIDSLGVYTGGGLEKISPYSSGTVHKSPLGGGFGDSTEPGSFKVRAAEPSKPQAGYTPSDFKGWIDNSNTLIRNGSPLAGPVPSVGRDRNSMVPAVYSALNPSDLRTASTNTAAAVGKNPPSQAADAEDFKRRWNALGRNADITLSAGPWAAAGVRQSDAGVQLGYQPLPPGATKKMPALDNMARSPWSVPLHELEHVPQIGRVPQTAGKYPMPKLGSKDFEGEEAKLRKYNQDVRRDLFSHEAPAVMAETVARMRSLDRTNPGASAKVDVRVPGYQGYTGDQIKRFGSEYLYGENPATGKIQGPQRFASDVMGNPAALQFFNRMGVPKTNFGKFLEHLKTTPTIQDLIPRQ